jgi:aryl-alcohol dehydrogenase-like predicted oxidoreductase
MAQEILQRVQGLNQPTKPKSPDPKKSDAPHVLPEQEVPDTQSRLLLRGAKHDVLIPYLCIGAWPWGDKATWNYNPKELPRIKEAWEILRTAGLNWVDTAQAFGSGDSERICGDLFDGLSRDEFVIQTKWFSIPDGVNLMLQSQAPKKKLQESLRRLRLDYVDIYLVHGHVHPSTISTVAKGLAECVEEGLTRAVGVTNYNMDDMLRMVDALAKHKVPLATNQCEYSVLRRHPELHGLIRACRDRGIVFQSYAPLAQGRLTGKYSKGNEPSSSYRFSNYPIGEIEPAISALREIAEDKRVGPAAVALNYNLSKGAVPVVGIRNPDQAKQNMQALGWRLSENDIRRIEAVSVEGKTSKFWQQG